MFWILTVCLFVLASMFVLAPLWIRTRSVDLETQELREYENITSFHERNNELEAELAAGNLNQDQFDALVAELQQNLLADVKTEGKDQSKAAKTRKAKSSSPQKEKHRRSISAVPIALSVLIPVLAYTLYSQWGYIDEIELVDLYQRTVNNVDDPEEAQDLIVSLGEVVRDDAEKRWAWYFLAENFANLRMFAEAEIAYQQSADRFEDVPDKALVLGRVAMAKYINADFKFTPDILQVIEQVRAINPGETFTLQLLIADAEQRQDYPAMIEYSRALIQANPNSAQTQALRANIMAAQQSLAGDVQDVASGPIVDVNLSIADGVHLADNLRVFIAARNAGREGMPPLAAIALTVADLPTTIRLDNSSAVGPFNLSSAETVFISALISFTNTANPQTGDYRVVSENFAHNGQHAVIDLVIADQIP